VSANGEGEASARIVELEAQVSALLAGRERDYEYVTLLLAKQIACAKCEGVLADIQKDLHRVSDAVCEYLELRR
jgi:hypothetical protein